MSKQTNTLVFILVATLFNIVAGVLSFVLFFLVYSRFIAPLLDAAVRPWGIPVILLASFGLTFALYQIAVRRFFRRINVKKHFSPLFRGRPDGSGRRPPEA